jgi:anti-sigma B factor antagonist
MELTTERFRRCDLVRATGRIDSQTAPQLADAFRAITGDGRHGIVLDMSGVEFISSAGLRVLVDVQKTCKHLGRGELVLASVPSPIHETLDLVGFVPLFQFFDDVVEAVGSF